MYDTSCFLLTVDYTKVTKHGINLKEHAKSVINEFAEVDE